MSRFGGKATKNSWCRAMPCRTEVSTFRAGRVAVSADGSVTKSVYQLDGFFTVKSFWFAAAAILAVAIAAWRALPRWYALVSLGAALVTALGGNAVANDGFLAPLGGLTEIAFLGLLVWIVASVVLLLRQPQPVSAAV